MKTTIRLNKKTNLGNYSEDHRFETFDLTIEQELDGPVTDESLKSAFDDLRAKIHDQEHDTILFFLENSHTEDKEEKDDGEIIL